MGRFTDDLSEDEKSRVASIVKKVTEFMSEAVQSNPLSAKNKRWYNDQVFFISGTLMTNDQKIDDAVTATLIEMEVLDPNHRVGGGEHYR